MTNSHPIVTVVIPTYNRGHVIRRALHSVLHQTYQNIEVIVVDDHSIDDTENIVASFNDPRVKYIRHQTTRGAAAARNTGINAAAGNFVAFQDSDDEWFCEKLERQMAIFEGVGHETGVVYSGFVRLQNNSVSYCPTTPSEKSGKILAALLNGNFITTQAAVVRKECFRSVGLFDESLPRLQDWELFLRIAQRYEFECIDEPLLLAIYSEASITANNSLLPIAANIVFAKHQELFCHYPENFSRQCYSLGKLVCDTGDLNCGRRYFKQSLKLNPLRLACLFRWALTFLGSHTYKFASKAIDKIALLYYK